MVPEGKLTGSKSIDHLATKKYGKSTSRIFKKFLQKQQQVTKNHGFKKPVDDSRHGIYLEREEQTKSPWFFFQHFEWWSSHVSYSHGLIRPTENKCSRHGRIAR